MVSRSGQIVRPCNTRSSPTFTTASTRSDRLRRSVRAAVAPRRHRPERTVITSETLEAHRYHRVVSTLDERLARLPGVRRAAHECWVRRARGGARRLRGRCVTGRRCPSSWCRWLLAWRWTGICTVTPRSVGPQGANYANLLSHSSGLGLEESDPVIPIATKRVYSNYGVELAVSKIVGENSAAQWLDDRVFSPLGLVDHVAGGRPGRGRERVDQRPRHLRSRVDALRPARSRHPRSIDPSVFARSRRNRAGLWPLYAVSVGDGSRSSRRQGALDGRLAPAQFRSLRPERLAALGERRRSHRGGGHEYRTLRRVGRVALAALDECRASPRSDFVSADALRVGLDLDGSLESLGNSMTDLADALDATHECELVRFHSLSAPRTSGVAQLRGRALWAPLWRRGLGLSLIDSLNPSTSSTLRAGDATYQIDAPHHLGG